MIAVTVLFSTEHHTGSNLLRMSQQESDRVCFEELLRSCGAVLPVDPRSQDTGLG